MKCKAKVSEMIRGLESVVDVANKNGISDFDQVGKVHLDVKDGEMVASAWNGRMTIDTVLSDITLDDFEYSCDEPGDITVNASELFIALTSFPPSQILIMESKSGGSGKEITLTLADDPDQYNTIPCYEDGLDKPEAASDITKEIVIRRDVFIRGINKVSFAVGFEKNRVHYHYWVLKGEDKWARFVVGSGSRFAAYDVDGDNIFKTKTDEFQILFPKEQTEVFLKVLSRIDDEWITIKESNPVPGPFQLTISCPSCEILLVGMDANIKWIDENTVLKADYNSKFITEIVDWAFAGKGTLATWDEQLKKDRKPHKGLVDVNFDKKNLTLKAETKMKSQRKIKIEDSSSDKKSIEFAVSVSFLADIAEHAEDKGFVQIEHLETDSGDKKRPVVVRYYAAQNVTPDSNSITRTNPQLNVDEKFSMFFAQLNV